MTDASPASGVSPWTWLALALQLVATLAWIAADRYPIGYEVCEHQLIARKAADALATTDSIPAWIAEHRRIWTRATGVHLLLAPLMHAWPGDDARLTAALVGVVCLLVIALSTAAIARALAPDTRAGPLAAAVVLLAPGVWGSARQLNMDLPLTAVVALLAAWTIARPPWDSPRAAAAAGLVAGLGCLVKAQLVFFLPWLVLASAEPALTETPRRAARALAAFAAAALVGSALFWAGSLRELLAAFLYHAADTSNASTELNERLSPRALAYYPLGLLRWAGLPSLALLIVGWTAVPALGRRARPLLWTVLGAWVVHQVMAVKWVRYLLPLLPLLVALGVAGATRRRGLRALAALALIGGVGVELLASTRPVPLWLVEPDLAHAPVRDGWADELAALAAAVPAPPAGARVGLRGPDHWSADDYTRFELRLRERWPAILVLRNSGLRRPEERLAYQREIALMRARIVLPPEPPPPGWREVHRAALAPHFALDGRPLPFAVWVPLRPLDDTWKPR